MIDVFPYVNKEFNARVLHNAYWGESSWEDLTLTEERYMTIKDTFTILSLTHTTEYNYYLGKEETCNQLQREIPLSKRIGNSGSFRPRNFWLWKFYFISQKNLVDLRPDCCSFFSSRDNSLFLSIWQDASWGEASIPHNRKLGGLSLQCGVSLVFTVSLGTRQETSEEEEDGGRELAPPSYPSFLLLFSHGA